LTGLLNSVEGKTVGTRLLLEIPPAGGYGSAGNSSLGVGGTDSLVFVVDILGTYNKNSTASGTIVPQTDSKLPTVSPGIGPPTITIPKNDPPPTTTSTVLIQGTGPAVVKGRTLVLQYHGVVLVTSLVRIRVQRCTQAAADRTARSTSAVVAYGAHPVWAALRLRHMLNQHTVSFSVISGWARRDAPGPSCAVSRWPRRRRAAAQR
jgi:hypothetical protein